MDNKGEERGSELAHEMDNTRTFIQNASEALGDLKGSEGPKANALIEAAIEKLDAAKEALKGAVEAMALLDVELGVVIHQLHPNSRTASAGGGVDSKSQ